MRNAKITITVPYDSIPREVENIMLRARLKISDLSEELKNQNCIDSYKILDVINNAREQMVLIDSNLQDAYNILLGYLKDNVDTRIETEKENES